MSLSLYDIASKWPVLHPDAPEISKPLLTPRPDPVQPQFDSLEILDPQSDPSVTILYTPGGTIPLQLDQYIGQLVEFRIQAKYLTLRNKEVLSHKLWGGNFGDYPGLIDVLPLVPQSLVLLTNPNSISLPRLTWDQQNDQNNAGVPLHTTSITHSGPACSNYLCIGCQRVPTRPSTLTTYANYFKNNTISNIDQTTTKNTFLPLPYPTYQLDLSPTAYLLEQQPNRNIKYTPGDHFYTQESDIVSMLYHSGAFFLTPNPPPITSISVIVRILPRLPIYPASKLNSTQYQSRTMIADYYTGVTFQIIRTEKTALSDRDLYPSRTLSLPGLPPIVHYDQSYIVDGKTDHHHHGSRRVWYSTALSQKPYSNPTDGNAANDKATPNNNNNNNNNPSSSALTRQHQLLSTDSIVPTTFNWAPYLTSSTNNPNTSPSNLGYLNEPIRMVGGDKNISRSTLPRLSTDDTYSYSALQSDQLYMSYRRGFSILNRWLYSPQLSLKVSPHSIPFSTPIQLLNNFTNQQYVLDDITCQLPTALQLLSYDIQLVTKCCIYVIQCYGFTQISSRQISPDLTLNSVHTLPTSSTSSTSSTSNLPTIEEDDGTLLEKKRPNKRARVGDAAAAAAAVDGGNTSGVQKRAKNAKDKGTNSMNDDELNKGIGSSNSSFEQNNNDQEFVSLLGDYGANFGTNLGEKKTNFDSYYFEPIFSLSTISPKPDVPYMFNINQFNQLRHIYSVCHSFNTTRQGLSNDSSMNSSSVTNNEKKRPRRHSNEDDNDKNDKNDKNVQKDKKKTDPTNTEKNSPTNHDQSVNLTPNIDMNSLLTLLGQTGAQSCPVLVTPFGDVTVGLTISVEKGKDVIGLTKFPSLSFKTSAALTAYACLYLYQHYPQKFSQMPKEFKKLSFFLAQKSIPIEAVYFVLEFFTYYRETKILARDLTWDDFIWTEENLIIKARSVSGMVLPSPLEVLDSSRSKTKTGQSTPISTTSPTLPSLEFQYGSGLSQYQATGEILGVRFQLK